MGFGIKTDFATGRQLDLNKSYKVLIKPVVEQKGLCCIRADEIQHSGSIDLYMYQQLLNADVVIADLSTANVNAFYELGIRHALRRRTTIVISEDKLAYPFDLNHIKITSYSHLGSAIDFEEVERFRKLLGETIDAVLQLDDPDSPVYTHLYDLIPPSIQKKAAEATRALEKSVAEAIKETEGALNVTNGDQSSTLAILAEQGEDAIRQKDFITAKALFHAAALKHNIDLNDGKKSTNSYLIHRLALATYKAKLPDTVTALKDAIELLKKLDLDHTNDPETVALAGKIEKRLYKNGEGEQHLANAILYYERGYFLLNNRYHGINLAFLLNKRVESSIFNTAEDKIADMVWASRIRRQVLKMCERENNEITEREKRDPLTWKEETANLSAEQKLIDTEEKFWILVNQAESHFGLGNMKEYRMALEAAKEVDHTEWMMKSFEVQISELGELMRSFGHLLNPPWKETPVVQPF
ncbi:MAG TPA: tetratricopeptide repeat-containing protein [Flavitalea sp.]|nr:tetratricopeptide repeat-containing protein [Flavitalea sp.]